MKYIFLLSGDYADLTKEEILSLFDFKKYRLFNRLLIAESKNHDELDTKTIKRLALTKNIYKLLFECKVNDLTEIMKSFGWNSVYKDNFCLRIYDFNENNKISNNKKHNKKIKNKKSLTTSESKGDESNPLTNFPEKELAGYIWRSVEKPKVSLENPKTPIHLFIINDKAYCGLLIHANNEDFESRKSHLRPFPSPSSLHPKIAKALVNISEIEEEEVLLDPFCGTGGFLMEAGLMGIKSVGYDINKIMIEGCRKNLEYFKIKKYKIKAKNATGINNKFDFVVTDLPYGLNSNVVSEYHKDNWKLGRINKKIQKEGFTKDLEEFYLQFLKNLRKRLKGKAVIVFPSYVNYRMLLKQSKFKIEKEFSNYVHRSLTRKIVKIS